MNVADGGHEAAICARGGEDQVVPVAADLGMAIGGSVDGGGLEPGRLRQRAGQEAALQRHRRRVLPREHALVVQHHAGAGTQVRQHGGVVLVEALADSDLDQQAHGGPAREQAGGRDRHGAAGRQLGPEQPGQPEERQLTGVEGHGGCLPAAGHALQQRREQLGPRAVRPSVRGLRQLRPAAASSSDYPPQPTVLADGRCYHPTGGSRRDGLDEAGQHVGIAVQRLGQRQRRGREDAEPRVRALRCGQGRAGGEKSPLAPEVGLDLLGHVGLHPDVMGQPAVGAEDRADDDVVPERRAVGAVVPQRLRGGATDRQAPPDALHSGRIGARPLQEAAVAPDAGLRRAAGDPLERRVHPHDRLVRCVRVRDHERDSRRHDCLVRQSAEVADPVHAAIMPGRQGQGEPASRRGDHVYRRTVDSGRLLAALKERRLLGRDSAAAVKTQRSGLGARQLSSGC